MKSLAGHTSLKQLLFEGKSIKNRLRWYNFTRESHLTKADLVEKIQTTNGFSKKESADILETLFGIMKSTLESGEKLRISGFGNFEIRQKADRRGRNPRTGETITIEARRILTFKPSILLKQAINSR
jgi:integration host factor subunit alpha